MPEHTPKPTPKRQRQRKRLLISICVCLSTTLVLLFAVLLALALTVFRVREPHMTLNSLSLQTSSLLSSGNVTVAADVSVTNPNALPYHFRRSTTKFFYKSDVVGEAVGPPGTAPARGVYRANVTVEVAAGGLVGKVMAAGEAAKEAVEVKSSTWVEGHVKVLVVRRKVDVRMNCSVTVRVANLTILKQNCDQHIWF